MGKKEKYKKYDDNYKYMYIFDFFLYMIGKKFLLFYCKLSFIYFVLWFCINERNVEIKIIGFFLLVVCLIFGII